MPISSIVEAASVPAKLLGELFVERGLITPEELEEALAEQKVNGKRLGEVLVMKGYVSGPALTTMLAEQLGVEMEKQDGLRFRPLVGDQAAPPARRPRQRQWDFGGRAACRARATSGSSSTAWPLRSGVLQPADGEEPEPEATSPDPELEELRQQLTLAATRLDEERAAHEGTQRLLEEARAEAQGLSREADEWRERAAQADDSDAKAEAAAAERARLEEIAAELRTDLDARDAELAESASARQSLEAQLEELRAGFSAREAELAGSAASTGGDESRARRAPSAAHACRHQA